MQFSSLSFSLSPFDALSQCKANKRIYFATIRSAQLSKGGREGERGPRDWGSFNFSLAQFVNHTKQKVKKKIAKVFNNYPVAQTHTHTHTRRERDGAHVAHFRCQLLSYFMYCAA